MNTALHIAVTNGHMTIAKLLVEADPSDKHVPNGNGDTPVYHAAKLGYNDLVKMICTTCRAPSLATTALHAAIMKLPQESVFRLLRDVQRLVNYADSSTGWTPLHYAAFYAFDSVLDVIVQAQSDFGYQFVSREKRTPLYVAAENAHFFAVIQLIQLLPGTCADVANTQIIVTALITTVTFTRQTYNARWIPSKWRADQGSVLLSKKTAFNAFMVSDALALVLSTSSLFLYFIASI